MHVDLGWYERWLARAYAGPGLVVLLVGVLAVSYPAAVLADVPVPSWWPGAALTMLVAAWAPLGRRTAALAVIGVGTVGAHLLSGDDAALATGLALSTVAEAAVVAWLVVWRRGPRARPQLITARDVGWYVAAVHAGVLVMGAGTALTVLLTAQAPALGAFGQVTASHGAAMMLLAPLGVRLPRPGRRVRRCVLAAHLATSGLVVAALFWPGQSNPLAFLVMPVLSWSAVRLSPRQVIAQLNLVSLVAAAHTASGGGPFASLFGVGTPVTLALTQVFVICCGLVALPLSLTAAQRSVVVDRLKVAEHLVRAGMGPAWLGVLLLRRCEPDRPDAGPGHEPACLDVADLNDVAAQMIGRSREAARGSSFTGVLPPAARGPLVAEVDAMLAGLRPGWSGRLPVVTTSGSRPMQLMLTPFTLASGEELVAAHLAELGAEQADPGRGGQWEVPAQGGPGRPDAAASDPAASDPAASNSAASDPAVSDQVSPASV